MEDQWKDKNIDLSALSKNILEFFSARGFETSLVEKSGEHWVVAAPKPYQGISERIRVRIWGTRNEFSVKFIGGSHSRALVRYGTSLSLFGLGFLVAKGLKSLEEIEKVEKDFWVYVDEAVWRLSKAK